MTAPNLPAIDALIAAVEAGEDAGASTYYTSRIFNPGFCHATNAYHGSLDAALALHNALLPGWQARPTCGGAGAGVTKWHCVVDDWDSGKEENGDNMPSPARAWLLATLKAYRAQVAG
jgi:hypothetical protein